MGLNNQVEEIEDLDQLYRIPLPSQRSGPLFNAFPYPTKISPEAIAIFIACHTKVGATVLDPFAGSGTTGLAGLLCDVPTPKMKAIAKELGVKPEWGPREVVLQELSTLGAFIGTTMCNPPDPEVFEKMALNIIEKVSAKYKNIYQVKDETGEAGQLRYCIWSDILVCPSCKTEVSFWDAAVTLSPLAISTAFVCGKCGCQGKTSDIERAEESCYDPIIGKKLSRKKRVPVKIYGRTGKTSWSRLVEKEEAFFPVDELLRSESVPKVKVNWGDLYRKGYHKGISYIHQFYSDRNLVALSILWDEIQKAPKSYQDALQLLVLSYNASHATLMSRVVVKQNAKDFALTGAQSGVLYISSLPVEKNIFQGVKRKVKTFKQAFELVYGSKSTVKVINASSTNLNLKDQSVDYVFTDPPFGGYIPYAEINQINEAWLGVLTEQKEEIIVSNAQSKKEQDYGDLMERVFMEINRVLKERGKFTLIFHSAKASIWKALMDAYNKAGFYVRLSSILDKVQGSFKQVTSSIKVQGDPLLLLERSRERKVSTKERLDPLAIIQNLLNAASIAPDNSGERKPEWLYSRFVSKCLEMHIPVSMNAEAFYKYLAQMDEKAQTLKGK